MDRGTVGTTQRTWLEEMTPDECIERLEASWLGRLGVTVGDHPEIFPVNHVYDRVTASIVFPTNARTKLHSALHATLVAFEVDGVDVDPSCGWSVLVIGPAVDETDPATIARAMALRRATWAISATTRWLRIRPTTTSGRRIQLVDA